jgi:hypothetical protein
MTTYWDWLWLLAIFPLWAVCTMVLIALCVSIEKFSNVALPDALFTWSAVGGLFLAAALLVVI